MTAVDQSALGNPTGLPGLDAGPSAGTLPPPNTGLTTSPRSSTIDLGNIDSNIQQINQVARGWGLPGLPDEVTLDLAQNHPDPASFLWGLASDINRAGGAGQAQDVSTQLQLAPQAPDSTGNPFREQAKSLFASMADLAQPTVYNSGSVEAIKQQAVNQGLMPASTPVDATWNPSMNEIAYQVSNNTFNQRVAGNRPGAMTVDSVMHTANDLFNPSVLGRMAMAMGVLPDPHKAVGLFHDLGHVFSSIGHVVTHPTNGGAWINFFHQVANSRGDFFSVVMPLVNDALLLTGVGEAIGAARAVVGAEELVRGLYAAREAGQLGRAGATVLRGASRIVNPATMESAAAPSRLAGLVGRVPVAGDKTEQLMNQWRQLRVVRAGKAAAGIVGRQGMVATLGEGAGGPGFNPGVGSPANLVFHAGIHNRSTVDQWKNQHLDNPALSGMEQFADLALAPQGYFAPGTIKDWAQKGHELGNSLHLISSQGQKNTSNIANALLDVLPEGEAKTAYANDIKSLGPSEAFKNHWAAGDPQLAGQRIAWATAVSGATADAISRAASQANPLDPERYWDYDRLVTNAVKGNVGKMTQVPANNPVAFLKALGSEQGTKAANQWRVLLESDDPAVRQNAVDKMNAYVADHNDKRKGFITQLLNQPGVENTVGQFLRTHFQNLGDWDNYDQAVRALHDTLEPEDVLNDTNPLEGVRLKRVYSPSGRLLGQRPKSTDPGQAVRNALADENPTTVSNAYVMPLVKDISGRMGLARNETVTAGDGRFLKAMAGGLQQRIRLMDRLAKNTGDQAKMQGFLDTLGQSAADTGQGAYSAALADHFGVAATDRVRSTANTIRHVQAALGPAAPATLKALAEQARDGAQRQLDALSGSSATWDQFNIPAYWDINKQLKMLDKAIPQLASEVEGLPDPLVAQLRELGYKPVHGARFVLPTDIADVAEPFATVGRLRQHLISMGNFIHPTLDHQIGGLLVQRLHNELSTALNATGHLDQAAHSAAAEQGLSGPVGDVIDRLYSLRRQQMAVAESGVASASGPMRKLIANYNTSIIPQNLKDFTRKDIQEALQGTPYLDKPGTPGEALTGRDLDFTLNKIDQAIKRSYDLGFSNEGLANLESKMVAYHPLVGGLKVLGKTRAGENLREKAGEALGFRAVRDAVRTRSPLPMITNPALAGAGLGALAGATQGNPLGGAAAGFSVGAAGAAGGRALAGATLGAAGGAVAGSQDHAMGPSVEAGALTGALAGVGLGRPVADKALSILEHNGSWYRYTNLGPTYVKLRNLARFSINPFFDARRYVKSAYLAFLPDLKAADGSPASLPLTRNVSTLNRDYGPGAMDQARSLYNAATDGMYDVLEETERWFSQRGILGFSGKDQMAATMYRLHQQGIDPQTAYDTSRKIFAYGQGRSPLEKSVNFVFFPFSFEKKLITQTGKFMAQDTSRLMFLHDAMATYQLLNSKYNLSGIWQRHLPILQSLQAMNAFDHGISPGELGGLNAPILNLFLPQMVSLDHSNAQKVKNAVNSLMPAYNDVDKLVQQTADEGHVIFSGSHLTKASEVDAGYAQWNAFKAELNNEAKARGYRHGYADVTRVRSLAPIKGYVDAYKAQLMDQYPAWAAALASSAAKTQLTSQALQVDLTEGKGPQFDKLRAYYDEATAAQTELKNLGVDPATSPEDVPPDIYESMRDLAISLASGGDGFGALYKKYYANTWGPIERPTR